MSKKAGESSPKPHAHSELDEKILQNLVELQKVHANLAEKFDSLAKQISQLLALFENTARSFAANPINQVSEKDQQFLEKVDKLLEQNKTIAKGLTLMEERIRDRNFIQQQQLQSTKADTNDDSETDTIKPVNTKPLPRF